MLFGLPWLVGGATDIICLLVDIDHGERYSILDDCSDDKMKYEKIRCERDPYKLWIGGMAPFCEHRHGDYEIAYCLKGNLDIILDKQTVPR